MKNVLGVYSMTLRKMAAEGKRSRLEHSQPIDRSTKARAIMQLNARRTASVQERFGRRG